MPLLYNLVSQVWYGTKLKYANKLSFIDLKATLNDWLYQVDDWVCMRTTGSETMLL